MTFDPPPIQYQIPASFYALPGQRGLRGWGLAFIILGSLLLAIALLGLLGTVLMLTLLSRKDVTSARMIAATICNSVLVVAQGGALIWAGVASRKGRRWVRPVAMAACGIVVAIGVSLVVIYVQMLVAAVTRPTQAAGNGPLPPNFISALSAVFGMLFAIAFAVVLPILVYRFYSRPEVATTLATLDPVPSWTGRAPVPVLGFAAWCVYAGVSFPLALLQLSGQPMFTALLRGPVSFLAAGAVAVVLVLSGVAIYFRSGVAWTTGVVVCGLVAASNLVFAVAGDSAALFENVTRQTRAMGVDTAAKMPSRPTTAGGVLYVTAAVYGLWARKFLNQDAESQALLPQAVVPLG